VPGTLTREQRIEILRDQRQALWPLIDYHSCGFCTKPRQPDRADFTTCFNCYRHRQRYGRALDELVPITYSAPTWTLGRAIRRFKDDDRADANHDRAASFGAILSAFLEQQLERIGRVPASRWRIVPVPSSKPLVVSALERAAREGWWTPAVSTDLISAREGTPRQRDRPGGERWIVEDKWEFDPSADEFGDPILLLDDMYTSGGTLQSLAHALKRAGVRLVSAVVIERNIGEDGEWVLPLLEEAVAAGRVWMPEESKRDVIGGRR
jgi:predicted amidophosphoribosyltransferase